MKTIYYDREGDKWYETETNSEVFLRKGMLIDTEMCDSGWEVNLDKQNIRYQKISYTECVRII